MDEFIRRKNIELFQAKLKRECSPDLREMLVQLLEEYETMPRDEGAHPSIAA